MHARVTSLLARIRADFGSTPVALPQYDEARITAHGMHFAVSLPREQLVAAVADRLQDDVVDSTGAPWPTVNGEPLFPSAESGVACWCLGGRPWCAVGQLSAALESEQERAAL
jgi:hypothetical protein